jgi:hypothetical protein
MAFSVLAILWARVAWRRLRYCSTAGRLRGIAMLVVATLLQLGNVYSHRGCHRLFFDEDVYANMATNLVGGYGPNVTRRNGPQGEVALHKWPVGFPTIAAVGVAIHGAERGPTDVNGVLAVLTALLCLVALRTLGLSDWLASAATAAYVLFPLVGPWYRSGSSEPLALLLALSAWVALVLAEKARHDNPQSFGAIALLSGFLAPLVRLEAVAALPFVLVWTWPTRPWRGRLGAVGLSAVALTLLGLHLSRLPQYYLSGRPESSFGLSHILPNIHSNLRFLLASGGFILLGPGLAGLAMLVFRANSEISLRRLVLRLWLLLLGPAMVLLPYSAGAYGRPGNSRFLLSLFLPAAMTLGLALRQITQAAKWPIQLAASLLPPALALTALPMSLSAFSLTDSPAREHEWVVNVALALPKDSFVISAVPYVWANQGQFTSSHLEDGLAVASRRPVYVHEGLLPGGWNASAYDGVRVESVITGDGTASLFRIRKSNAPASHSLHKADNEDDP